MFATRHRRRGVSTVDFIEYFLWCHLSLKYLIYCQKKTALWDFNFNPRLLRGYVASTIHSCAASPIHSCAIVATVTSCKNGAFFQDKCQRNLQKLLPYIILYWSKVIITPLCFTFSNNLRATIQCICTECKYK
jgi:hypothetical protein